MKIFIQISTALCLLLTMLGFVFQSQWESKILEQGITFQSKLTASSLKQLWLDGLMEALDSNALEYGFSLELDRSGSKLLTPFFPNKEISLSWQTYRSSENLEALTFLDRALGLKHSWDRILAITAYKQRFGKFPDIDYSGYENTILSEEAHEAYRRIFQVLQEGLDFGNLNSKIFFARCFFKINPQGNIVAFIPKKIAVTSLLAPFEQRYLLSDSSLGESALDLIPGTFQPHLHKNPPNLPKAFFAIALLCLLLSFFLYFLMLRKTRKDLQSKVSFLNQVVHELHTPLTSLKLHSQILSKIGFNAESIHAIEENCNRMLQLFGDITEINQSDKAVESIALSPEEFLQIIHALLEPCKEKISVEGILQQEIYTDPKRLKIVLHNLIQNALRYGKKGLIELADSGKEFSIMVRDDGPGISKAEAKQIFTPFHRGVDAQKSVPNGLGLGLSIARKIARELHGDLLLLNPGKNGAAFKLVFKRKLRRDRR